MITALLIATLTLTSVNTNASKSIDTADALGFTALMYAAQSKNPLLFEVLIEQGADVNAKNNAGATAVFIAARNGNIQAVARLIAAGADLTITNNNGHTAYDVAVMYKQATIAAMLKRHQEAQLARM